MTGSDGAGIIEGMIIQRGWSLPAEAVSEDSVQPTDRQLRQHILHYIDAGTTCQMPLHLRTYLGITQYVDYLYPAVAGLRGQIDAERLRDLLMEMWDKGEIEQVYEHEESKSGYMIWRLALPKHGRIPL